MKKIIMAMVLSLSMVSMLSCATPRPHEAAPFAPAAPVAPVALFIGAAVVAIGIGLLAPHVDAALVAATGPGDVPPPVCWTTTIEGMTGDHVFVDCSHPCDAHWSDPGLRADCRRMLTEHGVFVARETIPGRWPDLGRVQ